MATTVLVAPMDTGRLVAGNVRRLRLERGLSQEKLAFEADLDPSYVSQIETGAKSPTITTLEKVAAALRVKVIDFLDETSAAAPHRLRKQRR